MSAIGLALIALLALMLVIGPLVGEAIGAFIAASQLS